jgi:oligoribonuclease NrnB/cAMP/cGMP phosphodiesterase (DHH superfamily)
MLLPMVLQLLLLVLLSPRTGWYVLNNVVVVYHAKCYDGFTAAWIAKKAMPQATLVPATYGEPIPDIVTNLDDRDYLYLVDFSYPRDILTKLHDQIGFIRVLDHHKTAQANCEGLGFCVFDMEKSGAGLAWDNFYYGTPRPKLVDYVEDRDLWRFAKPDSAAVHAFISSYQMDLDIWTWMALELERDFDKCLASGKAILRYDDQKVEEMIQEAQHLVVAGHTVPVVNCPIQFGSKVGHRLLEVYPDAPFSAYYMAAADGTVRWGLRGRSSDDFDVSEVAKQFGGGGHKKASGFVLNSSKHFDIVYWNGKDPEREILCRN